MTEHDLSAWLASIAEIFDDIGVDWALIGALAANRYRATPRFTTDVDALAEFDLGLVERLEAAGYDVTVIADSEDPPHLLRCYRRREQIDILLPVVEYQVTALARGKHHTCLCVATPPNHRPQHQTVPAARIAPIDACIASSAHRTQQPSNSWI